MAACSAASCGGSPPRSPRRSPVPRLLVSLDLPAPLADAVALSLGESGGDG
jgi:hypothetical protein